MVDISPRVAKLTAVMAALRAKEDISLAGWQHANTPPGIEVVMYGFVDGDGHEAFSVTTLISTDLIDDDHTSVQWLVDFLYETLVSRYEDEKAAS